MDRSGKRRVSFGTYDFSASLDSQTGSLFLRSEQGHDYVFEEKLFRPVPYLAWPRGLYNDELIRLAQKVGYTALLTVDEGFNLLKLQSGQVEDSRLPITFTWECFKNVNDAYQMMFLIKKDGQI